MPTAGYFRCAQFSTNSSSSTNVDDDDDDTEHLFIVTELKRVSNNNMTIYRSFLVIVLDIYHIQYNNKNINTV